MHHTETEDLRALDERAFSELFHQVLDLFDPEEEPAAFADPGPSVATKTALGEQIVAVAKALLKKPVREDAGSNEDKDGQIRSFFLEGVPWKASYWDDWVKNHPQSPVPRPEWCAAFACYCVRKGYAAQGLSAKLPKALSASTSGLRELFIKLGRFIHRDDLFDDKGSIRPGAKIPGPGDIVLWQGHTGLLFDITEDGSYQTIEGNTKSGKDSVQGVYLLPNSSTRKISKDGKMIYSLTGFCQLASWDGVSREEISQAAAAPATAPAAAAENDDARKSEQSDRSQS